MGPSFQSSYWNGLQTEEIQSILWLFITFYFSRYLHIGEVKLPNITSAKSAPFYLEDFVDNPLGRLFYLRTHLASALKLYPAISAQVPIYRSACGSECHLGYVCTVQKYFSLYRSLQILQYMIICSHLKRVQKAEARECFNALEGSDIRE